MNRQILSGADSLSALTPLEDMAAFEPSGIIRLNSCPVLEPLVVKTRRSSYEIIVLSGDTGEVMVRGGDFFPEFTRAHIVGSTFGRSAVNLRCICVGLCLELNVERKRFVTSAIQAVSRRWCDLSNEEACVAD